MLLLKIFFYFRTAFFSTTAYLLVIFLILFKSLDIPLWPGMLIVTALYLFIFYRAIKKMMKDLKSKKGKVKSKKDILVVLILSAIFITAVVLYSRFDYYGCINTGYCFR